MSQTLGSLILTLSWTLIGKSKNDIHYDFLVFGNIKYENNYTLYKPDLVVFLVKTNQI